MAGLDFGKLTRHSVVDTATEPRRIFAALPTRDPKYARPWDVQAQVWDRWHERRTEPDLLVKMNTGGGKTVVGLMIVQSANRPRHEQPNCARTGASLCGRSGFRTPLNS